MPDTANILANALANQWNYTTKPCVPPFIKLTDTILGEIIINLSAITFINIKECDVCVSNTDVLGNGMLHLTDDSLHKLLEVLNYE